MATRSDTRRDRPPWIWLVSLLSAAPLLLSACSAGADDPASSTDNGAEEADEETIEETVLEEVSSDRFTAHPVGQTDAPLGYYEYTPPDYGDGSLSPLLVFLHGFGGNGDGSFGELDKVLETGIPEMIRSDRWPESRPFLVLVPQHGFVEPIEDDPCLDVESHFASCSMQAQSAAGHPQLNSPCMTPNEIDQFLTFAIDVYDVDPNRVYLTGISCGAYSVWEYIAAHGSERVAAAVPIAGDGRPAWTAVGCDLGEVPIWAFHGDRDDVVHPDGSVKPLTALSSCREADAELTVYPGVDHDGWNETYDLSAGHDIYEWMLDHVGST